MKEEKNTQWHPAFTAAIHIWINSLTNNISEQHVRKLVKITKDLRDLDDQNYADSIWEVVATENAELMHTKSMRRRAKTGPKKQQVILSKV